MSFWEQNKGTFKSAGAATIKGVSHGTKALGNAGYNTYKNRTGNPSSEPEPDNHVSGALPALTKEQLHAMPAPPRRGQPQPQQNPPAQSIPAQPIPAQPISGQPISTQPISTQPISTQPAQQNQTNTFQQNQKNSLQQNLTNSIQQNLTNSIQQNLTNSIQQNLTNSIQQNQANTIQQNQKNPIQPIPAQQNQTNSTQTAPAIAQLNLLQQSAPHIQTLGNIAANPHVQSLYQHVNGQAPGTQNQEIPSYSQATETPPVVPPRIPGIGNPASGQSAPTEPNAPTTTPDWASAYESSVPVSAPNTSHFANPTSSNVVPATAGAKPNEVKVPNVDVSMFAPPPVHKNRGGSSSPKNTSKPSTSPAPQLPSRSSANRVQDPQSFPNSDQVPPPYSMEAPANTRNGQKQSEPRESQSVYYTELDPSKVGPPPPRRHDSVAKGPSSGEQGPSTPQTNSSVGLPPPPPPRSASASSASTVQSVPASISNEAAGAPAKPKKAPPPKPKKSSALAMNPTGKSSEPTVDLEHETEPKAPAQTGHINFAAEIANLRLAKNTPLEMQKSSDSEVDSTKTPPPKPVKPQISAEETSFGKAKQAFESESRNTENPPVKPAKPVILSKPEKPAKLSAPQVASAEATSAPDSIYQEFYVSPSSESPPPIPPHRNYKREITPIRKVVPWAPEFDLELSSGWFASSQSPIKLPKAFRNLNYSTKLQSTTSKSGAKKTTNYTRNLIVVFTDLAKMEYSFKWTNQDISKVSVKMVKYDRSPIFQRVPTKRLLLLFSSQFGEHIASWCQHQMGKKIGRGECWDLAKYALEKACGNQAFVSQYTHHGYPILEMAGSKSGPEIIREAMDEIRPGDILQFKSAKFENKAKRTTQTVGSPDHTSVVVGKEGDRILVLEQNVGNDKTVQRGEYILRNITKGRVVVYRAMPKMWAE